MKASASGQILTGVGNAVGSMLSGMNFFKWLPSWWVYAAAGLLVVVVVYFIIWVWANFIR